MPYANDNKRREHGKVYRELHKEKLKLYQGKYRAEHLEIARAYRKQYYEAHKEDKQWRQEALAKARQSYRELRLTVLTHYGHGKCACVRCGFMDIRGLTIDHINDDGAKHRKTREANNPGKLCRWLRNNNFPEGYQTLCMNCQSIKRQEMYDKKIAQKDT